MKEATARTYCIYVRKKTKTKTKKKQKKTNNETNLCKSPSFKSGGESKQGTNLALQSKMATYSAVNRSVLS